MQEQLEALLLEWKSVRECSKAFLAHLSDADLDRQLPRKGLDTIRKHLREMVEVQRDFVTAIDSSIMRFNDVPDSEIDGSLSREELLADIEETDASLADGLERAGSDTGVEWFGKRQLLSYHVAALIAHEAMHVGQIIAFCYVLGVRIPELVRKAWALSGE